MQAYSNPRREQNPYALPDVEVFYIWDDDNYQDEEGNFLAAGWYWHACFLPDGDPMGPFATEAEALADAQDGQQGRV